LGRKILNTAAQQYILCENYSMSTERFHIVYDGLALAEHRMDVRDLAPALVAIGNLATQSNRVINGDAADIRVEVHASFKAGSFGIEMFLSQDIVKQITDIFSGQHATALANIGGILGLIGLTGDGLFALLKTLRGRVPVKVDVNDNGSATLWITETESMIVEDHRIVELYRNREVRLSVDKLLSPLESEGISSFGVVKNDQVIQSVTDDELPYFKWQPPQDNNIVSDTLRHKILLLLESAVFKDGNKWRFHDGQSGFHAAITDVDFLARIENGERFGKGDILVADLRTVQTVSNKALNTTHELAKVHEHREPLQQPLL
jgi:hypothetical protein